MGIFDFFSASDKDWEIKVRQNQIQYQQELEDKRKKIKYAQLKDVSTIVIPKIGKNVIWKDLSGKTVSKIPTTYRDLSYSIIGTNKVQIWFYLGLKKFKKSERWVPVNKEEVDRKKGDIEFVKNHSVKSKQEKLEEEKKLKTIKFKPQESIQYSPLSLY